MIKEYLYTTYFGNTLLDYIIFLVIVSFSIVIGKVVYYIIRNILKHLAKKSETKVDDILLEVLDHPLVFLIFIIGLYFGYHTLVLSEGLKNLLSNIVSILLIVDVAWFVIRLFDQLIVHYIIPLASKTETDLDDALMPIIRKLSKYGIGIISGIMILDKFGYNITSLVAGLGIGGLAVALAAKDMLGNMFGGASILTDKPFKIGDKIKFDGLEGNVSEVGLRSTKIKSMDGSELIVPNAKIADSVLENVSREKARRIRFTIGVTYETSNDKLQKAVELINAIFEKHPDIEKGTHQVFFSDFADSSLNFTVVYWIINLDKIFEIRNDVNFAIKKQFEKAGIDFAYPTRTLYMKK